MIPLFRENNTMNDGYEHPENLSYLAYTSTNIPGPACPDEFFTTILGCDCFAKCKIESCTCIGTSFRLKESKKGCSSLCPCDLTCDNRFFDKGPLKGLEVFETEKKGHGLKTRLKISKGEFVCEYAGEAIGQVEADRRFSLQRTGDSNYIFVLKEFYENKFILTIVDPEAIGNIGRYINHSCEPNLCPVPVRTETAFPHISFFSVRDIDENEELTYSYGTQEGKNSSKKKCYCGTKSCSGFLPNELPF